MQNYSQTFTLAYSLTLTGNLPVLSIVTIGGIQIFNKQEAITVNPTDTEALDNLQDRWIADVQAFLDNDAINVVIMSAIPGQTLPPALSKLDNFFKQHTNEQPNANGWGMALPPTQSQPVYGQPICGQPTFPSNASSAMTANALFNQPNCRKY